MDSICFSGIFIHIFINVPCIISTNFMIPIFFWWSHNIPSFSHDENPDVSPGRHRCALPVTLRFGRPGAQTLGDAHGARRKRPPGPGGAVVPEVSRHQRSQTFIDFPHQSHGNLPNPIEILMVLSHECVFYWRGELVDDGWWWLLYGSSNCLYITGMHHIIYL